MILMDDIEKMWKLFDQFGPKAVGLFLGKRGPQFNEASLCRRVVFLQMFGMVREQVEYGMDLSPIGGPNSVIVYKHHLPISI